MPQSAKIPPNKRGAKQRLARFLQALFSHPSAVTFRLKQEFELRTIATVGGWKRLAASIENRWSVERAAEFLDKQPPVVTSTGGARAFLRSLQQHPELAEGILDYARSVRERNFTILTAPIPPAEEWPWHTDWRFGHTWPPTDYRSYSYYEPRDHPYDVKYPWELSRLWFLPGLLQADLIDSRGGWAEEAVAILSDWERVNPLAGSVNWHPMEASMRAVSLLFAFEILKAHPRSTPTHAMPFLRQIHSHGEFIWRNLEYTDVRGNHYVANIVALLLIGLVLEGQVAAASKWSKFAARAIDLEIPLQISSDGVFFDRSVPYHRLVTELFLLALIVLERRGDGFSSKSRELLRLACRYARACRRPDGLSPNVGDNDSAKVFHFGPVSLRDFGDLSNLSAAYFCDSQMKVDGRLGAAAIAWLLGEEGVERFEKMSPTRLEPVSQFRESGVIICRHDGNFLWMDIGRFGKVGRGGHGHNDLFSFELVLNGAVLAEDPGCPVYAAEPDLRNLFRSTAYHNGMRIDGEEIVELKGIWEIGEDRAPFDVAIEEGTNSVRVSASHDNYARLNNPVVHRRSILFDYRRGRFECFDRIDSSGEHLGERFLHLPTDVTVDMRADYALLQAGGRTFRLDWNPAAEARLDEGLTSPHYGAVEKTSVVVLSDHLAGKSEVFFRICSPVEAPLSPDRPAD